MRMEIATNAKQTMVTAHVAVDSNDLYLGSTYEVIVDIFNSISQVVGDLDV